MEKYAVSSITRQREPTFAEAFSHVIAEAKRTIAAVDLIMMLRDDMSVNPDIRDGGVTPRYNTACTCRSSIIDCEACFAGKSSKGANQSKLNKFGDVPNPVNQKKAARRRQNRELRLQDPAAYKEMIAVKKGARDEHLRAERHKGQ